MAHIFGCIFYAIGKIEIDYKLYLETWIHNDDIVYAPYHVKYLYSFYWASSSIISDKIYSPKTPIEAAFACIIQFTSFFLFGIFLIFKIYLK